jgi:hypothetical protein
VNSKRPPQTAGRKPPLKGPRKGRPAKPASAAPEKKVSPQPAAQGPRPKPAAKPGGPRKAVNVSGSSPRVKWLGAPPSVDFKGKAIRREYKVETLQWAIERLLADPRDPFFMPGILAATGGLPPASLTFQLVHEGEHQFRFMVQAVNTRRQTRSMVMIVSKQSGTPSDAAQAEHASMRELHRVAGNAIARPYSGGMLHLPERRGRPSRDRMIYVWLQAALDGFLEFGPHDAEQFAVFDGAPRVLAREMTETIKGRMLALEASTLDPVSGVALHPDRIRPGDLAVSLPHGGNTAPQLRVTGCGGLLRRAMPARLLHAFLSATWVSGRHESPLAPSRPETIVSALVHALGRPAATEWLQAYAREATAGKFKGHPALPLESIPLLLSK